MTTDSGEEHPVRRPDGVDDADAGAETTGRSDGDADGEGRSPADGADEAADAPRVADGVDGSATATGASDGADAFGWRGWVLVGVVVVSVLVVPGVIYLYPAAPAEAGLPFFAAMLALPMLPAVLLGATAVWSMTAARRR